MKKAYKARKSLFGAIACLVGLIWAQAGLCAEFPPKQMCLVDADHNHLILIAATKPAGPTVRLRNSSYKFFVISALTEGGPMIGNGAFYYPPYFDVSLTGGGSAGGYHYRLDLRLDPVRQEGTYRIQNLESGFVHNGTTRLRPCSEIP